MNRSRGHVPGRNNKTLINFAQYGSSNLSFLTYMQFICFYLLLLGCLFLLLECYVRSSCFHMLEGFGNKIDGDHTINVFIEIRY